MAWSHRLHAVVGHFLLISYSRFDGALLMTISIQSIQRMHNHRPLNLHLYQQYSSLEASAGDP
jgi:hypothetical protein